jgi:hypothetical protein
MVGVSGNPTRASYRALVPMKSKGYTVYPVNPSYDEILGLKCYKPLLDIPDPVDIVDIFRRADTVLPLIGEALEVGAKVFWMQIGVVHEEAAAQAAAAGLEVVMDRCVKIEHCRFFGQKDYGLERGGTAHRRVDLRPLRVRLPRPRETVRGACQAELSDHVVNPACTRAY